MLRSRSRDSRQRWGRVSSVWRDAALFLKAVCDLFQSSVVRYCYRMAFFYKIPSSFLPLVIYHMRDLWRENKPYFQGGLALGPWDFGKVLAMHRILSSGNR